MPTGTSNANAAHDREVYRHACAALGLTLSSPGARISALSQLAPPGSWRTQQLKKEQAILLDDQGDEAKNALSEAERAGVMALGAGMLDAYVSNGAGQNLTRACDAVRHGHPVTAAEHVSLAAGKVALNAALMSGKAFKAAAEILEVVGESRPARAVLSPLSGLRQGLTTVGRSALAAAENTRLGQALSFAGEHRRELAKAANEARRTRAAYNQASDQQPHRSVLKDAESTLKGALIDVHF
jgi:hypothetical protein